MVFVSIGWVRDKHIAAVLPAEVQCTGSYQIFLPCLNLYKVSFLLSQQSVSFDWWSSTRLVARHSEEQRTSLSQQMIASAELHGELSERRQCGWASDATEGR